MLYDAEEKASFIIICRMLSDNPPKFVEGVEQVVQACIAHFWKSDIQEWECHVMRNGIWRDKNEFFDSFYRQNFNKMRKFAATILSNAALAEEVVQDAFIEVFIHIDYLMSVDRPEWWLQKTVKNKALHVLRDHARDVKQLILLESLDIEDLSAAEKLLEIEERKDLKQKITNTLKPNELYLLRRITIDGASYKKVSSELGISISACQKRAQRIREKLKKFPL